MAISFDQVTGVFPADDAGTGAQTADLDWDVLLAEEAAKLPPLAREVELASVMAARLLHHVTHIACSTGAETGSAFLEDVAHYLMMVDDTLHSLIV